MSRADRLVKATRTQQQNRAAKKASPAATPGKPRKARSDKGSSKRLKQVAGVRKQGKSIGAIAKELGLGKSTIQGYVEDIKARGGMDAVLSPNKRVKKVATTTESATFLYTCCPRYGYEIPIRTARTVDRNVRQYIGQIGVELTVTEGMIRRALRDPKDRNRRALELMLKHLIADWACKQDPNLEALVARIRKYGLPIPEARTNGRPLRTRPLLASAVATASRAIRDLYGYLYPSDFQFDIEEFWQEVERWQSIAYAVISIGEKKLSDGSRSRSAL
jgi:hypothetical protein